MDSTKAYRTWSDRLDVGRLTKGQIQQFGSAVEAIAWGEVPRGRRTNLRQDEARSLVARISHNPVLLTEEHTEQGITWLERHGRKALDMPADVHEDVISHFSHFSWDGGIRVFGAYRNVIVPVWTVHLTRTMHLTSGRRLRYWYAPWVSGVNESGWTWA